MLAMCDWRSTWYFAKKKKGVPDTIFQIVFLHDPIQIWKKKSKQINCPSDIIGELNTAIIWIFFGEKVTAQAPRSFVFLVGLHLLDGH